MWRTASGPAGVRAAGPRGTARNRRARHRRLLLGSLSATCALLATACSGGAGPPAGTAPASPVVTSPPPLAALAPPGSLGRGEGVLDLLGRPGYLHREWVRPFERQTGCQVRVTAVSSADRLAMLMRGGGGGRYDLVSAPADVSLGLIWSGDLRPLNVNLIGDWKNLWPQLQGPAFNTVEGVHYGVSLVWRPNVLLYQLGRYPTTTLSWEVVYDSLNRGRVTVPNDPMQIADAALYLAQAMPSLGITDPYELTGPQFRAAVALLRRQRPLVAAYWSSAAQEVSLFERLSAWVGVGWPAQTTALQSRGITVADTVPQEGVTGWADSWMLAARAPHPNCAYRWLSWVSRPDVEAEQAMALGAAPANTLACRYMNLLAQGGCAAYRGNISSSYLDSIRFWKTPLAACGDGSRDCVPYAQWRRAWDTQVLR